MIQGGGGVPLATPLLLFVRCFFVFFVFLGVLGLWGVLGVLGVLFGDSGYGVSGHWVVLMKCFDGKMLDGGG